MSHPSEYPLVNLPEAKRAHDQQIRIGRFGLGQQSNSNMLVPPSAGSSYLRWLFGLGDEVSALLASYNELASSQSRRRRPGSRGQPRHDMRFGNEIVEQTNGRFCDLGLVEEFDD